MFRLVLQASEAATHKVPYKQTFRKSKLDPEQRAEVRFLHFAPS